MIDSHAHLYLHHFEPDISDVLQRSKDCGIEKILLPNIDMESVEPMMNLALQYPDFLIPMMGLHPTSVTDNYRTDLKAVEGWLNKYDFCAIGEIGIDLYWDKTFLPQQQKVFETQVAWAIAENKPIVIHARDSFSEIFESLRKFKGHNLKGVFHSFTGGIKEVEEIETLGNFYFGINGIVTFKNSHLPQVISKIGLSRLLLETDSPYLAPAPFRGKRNESSFLAIIKDKIANLLNVSAMEVDKETTINTQQLFNIPND